MTYDPIHDIFSDIRCWYERRDMSVDDTTAHDARENLGHVYMLAWRESDRSYRILARYHRILVSTGRIPCPTVAS